MNSILIDQVSRGEITVVRALELYEEWKSQGDWFPANGGTEVPFTTRSGHRLLYVWQPRSGRHAYLNLGTDLIIPDDQINLYMD